LSSAIKKAPASSEPAAQWEWHSQPGGLTRQKYGLLAVATSGLAAGLLAGCRRALALASTALRLALAILATTGVHALAAVFATIALGLGVAAAGSQHQRGAAQGGSQHQGFLDHGINAILVDKKTGLCRSPAEMVSAY